MHNRRQAHELAMEGSVIAQPIVDLVRRQGRWEGTMTELYGIISTLPAKPDGWPRNAQALSGKLRQLAPNLRAMGINFRDNRSGKARTVVLEGQVSDSGKGSGDAPGEK